MRLWGPWARLWETSTGLNRHSCPATRVSTSNVKIVLCGRRADPRIDHQQDDEGTNRVNDISYNVAGTQSSDDEEMTLYTEEESTSDDQDLKESFKEMSLPVAHTEIEVAKLSAAKIHANITEDAAEDISDTRDTDLEWQQQQDQRSFTSSTRKRRSSSMDPMDLGAEDAEELQPTQRRKLTEDVIAETAQISYNKRREDNESEAAPTVIPEWRAVNYDSKNQYSRHSNHSRGQHSMLRGARTGSQAIQGDLRWYRGGARSRGIDRSVRCGGRWYRGGR